LIASASFPITFAKSFVRNTQGISFFADVKTKSKRERCAVKVLLINPVIRQSESPKYFPLGLGLIAAVLIENGHDVAVFDNNALRLGPAKVESQIAASDVDLFALTGLVTDYAQVKLLAATIKQYHPYTPILLGGGLASSFGLHVVNSTKVDFALPGEGEIALVSLLTAIQNNTAMQAIPGIVYHDGTQAVSTGPASIVQDLDALPMTRYDLFPVDSYLQNMRSAWMFSQPTRALSVLTSRGCPFHCIYCDKAIFGNRYRQRSVDSLIDEIEKIVNDFALEGILFADDTMTLKKKTTLEFCAKFRERLPNIRWAANGRVGCLDEETIAAMAAANCDTIGFGIESGSQIILDELQKNVKAADAKKTIALVQKHGIRPLGYITVGSFSETEQTIKQTIDFLKETQLKAGVNFLTPFPGTPLFEKSVRLGKVSAKPEQLLDKWGAWQETLMVNLSDLPDEKLMMLKKQVELHCGGPDKSKVAMSFTLPETEKQRLWEKAVSRIAADGHERFVLFGAGKHTVRFLEWHKEQEAPFVSAVFDQDPSKIERGEFHGKLVVENHDFDRDGPLLLSSDAYEDEMYQSALDALVQPKNIYRIYDDD
jgi:radical SAM superfamily enzyme YgiQ (UPF0313 family)